CSDPSTQQKFDLFNKARVVFNIGLNTNLKENARISPNMERSEFSFYNADKLINANISYAFWVVE
ncbi:TPA: autotransporter outer membrane beta-barrel domain-containing protein, partial [Klebsiella pneumoniae]